jgi:aryl-alcohol dehydrogenase-like predicted oxidoreductase
MKLVLGGAQIGMDYGYTNNRRVSLNEFKKIEKLVLRSKIKFVDTAKSYGCSERVIGNSKLKKLNI